LAGLIERCMAKAPADRPTAAEVSQLASTLAGGTDSATTIAMLPTQGLGAPVGAAAVDPSPTRTLPVQPTSNSRPRREGRRATIVMSTVVGILVILIGFAIARDANRSNTASAKTGHGNATHKSAPPKVKVVAADYVGQPYQDAQSALKQLGMKPVVSGTVTPTTSVASVWPTGKLRLGHHVHLTLSAPVTPSTPVSQSAPSHPTPPSEPHKAKPEPPGHVKHGWHGEGPVG
jgi:hypothetical protein